MHGPQASTAGARVGGAPHARAALRTVFVGSALGGFSSSNKVITVAGASNMAFAPGYTLVLRLNNLQATGNSTEGVIGCMATTTAGWRIYRNAGSNGGFAFFADGSSSNRPLTSGGAPALGITTLIVVWRASDNHLLVSWNGTTLADFGATSPGTSVNGTTQSFLGNSLGGNLDLTSAEIVAAAILHREASQSEVTAWGLSAVTSNRFKLPSALTGDALCTFDFDARRDYSAGASSIVTHGSAPVTFPVSGSPTPHALDEIVIPTSDAMYWDSKIRVTHTNAVQRNAEARLHWTGITATQVAVDVYSDMAFATQYANVGAFKGGSYVASLGAAGNVGTRTTYDLVALGAGTKVLDLVEGSQVDPNATGVVQGSYIVAVRVPVNGGGQLATPSSVQKRLVVLGDSIVVGFYPTTVQTDALAPLLRADFPSSGTGGVTIHGWGGLSLYALAHDAPTLAATAATIAAELDGTSSNVLWVELGTNDYGQAVWSAAAFGAAYGALLDAVRALVPGVVVYCQSPIQRISPAVETANANGDTLGAFRTAISTAASARSAWCTYVEGAAAAIVSNANMYTDGVHITTAGYAQYKAAIKTAVGY